MSPEVKSMVVLLMGLLAIRFATPVMLRRIGFLLQEVVRLPATQHWNGALIQQWYAGGIVILMLMLLPVFIPIVLGAVVSNMVQTGPYFSIEALAWKPAALNPVKGLKSLFSAQSVVNMVLSIMKVALVVMICYLMIRKHVLDLGTLPFLSVGAAVRWILTFAFRISLAIVLLFFAIAIADWCHRKYRFEKSIMMTKDEVKEERKQHETSPVVKRQQRRKWQELTMLRMMAEVPKADVVITNPTHVAVALRYDPESMAAPRVVAKGLRLVAERIKAVARQHHVGIVERPELARDLHKNVEIGQQIPSRFYAAVAAVLAYLHRLRHGTPAQPARTRHSNTNNQQPIANNG